MDGERGEDAGAEEAVGGKGLEVGGDAGATGGVMAGDGEEGTFRKACGGGQRR